MHSSPWDILTAFASGDRGDLPQVDRGQVAEAVFSLCASNDVPLSATETTLAFDILEALYPQIERMVRRVLADRLADRTDVPASLMTLLARDTIDIARPILVRSPALDDSTLIAIVMERGLDHRQAISERKVLSRPLTDVLLVLGDDTVAMLIASNPQTEISGNGFLRLIERAEYCPDLQWPLARRAELTPTLAARLSLCAGTAVQTYLKDVFGADLPKGLDQELFAAAEDACGPFTRRSTPPGSASAVSPGPDVPMNSLLDGFVKALRNGQPKRADDLMAKVARLPAAAVAQILYTPAGRALAVVCRSGGASRQVFAETYARLNGIAPYGTSQRSGDLIAALRVFDRITAAEADRILDGWRADPGSVWE
ncbi:DUF2336 domain-containing protein [Novispirillum itersonii]|uniref:DUF2336 domain-containing protein n=1 Tax=Novispirillum itersonii TaxID=189 RepID=UPI00036C24D8|nr:DUF2336 domain-containing protein [Novispirillum itersonii]